MSGQMSVDHKELTAALAKVQEQHADSIQQIVDMGFPRDQAIEALNQSGMDVAKAVEYIFSGGAANSGGNRPEDSAIGHIEDADLAKAVQSSFENENSASTSTPATSQSSAIQPSQPPLAQQAMQQSVQQYGQTYFEPAMSFGPQPDPQQETGVVGGGSFGPATRDYYQSEQWNMVPCNPSRSPTAFYPYPRLRQYDEPPFLLRTPETEELAALLFILHKIPLARKALLDGGQSIIEQYPYSANWWENPSASVRLRNHYALMAIECQKLIAFLDGASRRSYATAQSLVSFAPIDSLEVFNGTNSSQTRTGQLLMDLCQYWGTNSEFYNAFSTTACNTREKGTTVFANLVCDVTVGLCDSLYKIVDDMVWSLDEADGDAYMDHIGDVLTLTLKRDDGMSGAGITVPTVWYPERYSKRIYPYLKRVRDLKKSLKKKHDSRSAQHFNTRMYMGQNVKELLATTEEFLRDLKEDPQDNDLDSINSAYDDIQRVAKSFGSRVDSLKNEVADLQSRAEKYGKLFMDNEDEATFRHLFPDEAEMPRMEPYYLQGAIISPVEYYVCWDNMREFGPKDDLIDLDSNGNSDEAFTPENLEEKWWHVEPATDGAPTIREVPREEVIAAISSGSKDFLRNQEVVLIYANRQALDYQAHNIPLPDLLQEFMMLDKKALVREVRSLTTPPPAESFNEVTTSRSSESSSSSDSGESSDEEEVGPQQLPPGPEVQEPQQIPQPPPPLPLRKKQHKEDEDSDTLMDL
ncbi:hypothetical protein TRVA0_007S01486 [Trichomonascus vanleenenianus]|uniref:uncharacterized protein n=1 Tax=Trichomonascus vanleenenianus TaxID=2268995 RepID=UPI003ECAC70F